MTTTRNRTIVTAIVAIFAGLTMFTSTGSAQCAIIKVKNTLNCDLQLCLFQNTAVATACFNIPANSTTDIVLPAGFSPDGAVSAAGTRFRFNAAGCTDCFTFTTAGVVPCCGVVCYDALTCHMTISICTQAHCNP